MQAFPHASLYQVGPIHKGSGYWFQGRMPGKSSLYDIRCFTHVQSLSPEQRLVVALELQQRYQQLEREAAERQERREAMWLEGLSPEQRLEARRPAGAFCVIVSVTRMHALLHVLACAWDVSALLASVCLQLAHV